jgi:hypothetical protein
LSSLYCTGFKKATVIAGRIRDNSSGIFENGCQDMMKNFVNAAALQSLRPLT